MNPIVQDLEYEFDFQFVDIPNMWLRCDIKTSQALETIRTGLLNNRAVSKIKLFAITGPEHTVCFVYDIVAAKQGNFPWTITQ